jgi:hypothetical protein
VTGSGSRPRRFASSSSATAPSPPLWGRGLDDDGEVDPRSEDLVKEQKAARSADSRVPRWPEEITR